MAIAPNGVTFNGDKKHSALRERLKHLDAEIDKLPGKTFAGSGTNVETVLIRVRR